MSIVGVKNSKNWLRVQEARWGSMSIVGVKNPKKWLKGAGKEMIFIIFFFASKKMVRITVFKHDKIAKLNLAQKGDISLEFKVHKVIF